MERRDAPAVAPDRPRGRPAPGGQQVPHGPRQEYLDAFDRAEPLGTPAGGARSAEGPSGASTRAARRRAGSVSAPEPGEGGGGRAERRERQRREGRESWGRSLVGVTALALVTVLVVLVAGQLARPDRDADATTTADEGERFALDPDQGSDARPAPSDEAEDGAEPEPEPEPEPSYDELLATTFPLDPDLTGSGELVPVPGTEPAADPDATMVLRYRVDVEEGLGIDPAFFAEAVHRTLSDERSWGNAGERGFARVSDGDYDFVVTLASPGTTADWCARSGLDTTEDNVSCNSSSTDRVMINAWRFAQGSETYGDDIADYRRMLVNHEVGHRLGYGHAVCPGEGALAPVMMQQTKFLTIDGVTCRANPWPHPDNG
ncbi:DUF3152 domain-containing protein [Streptomyces sp. 3MP-14]|uniref:DUF3152 domain-containing protein n=1 Tax=Streptomyces mimosae TaxID=2586635 RepID=A0A5N6AA13_9ACTN|nr:MULTISPECIES: DUF3152 domain-containing protein [Streptomyces]KAB8165102.1 DUF3152 domain-containing protein [Streptomyces mimosae]KAB8175734.1 DUF3152 domain-containing protein [Streptomyces sp. 3MP-14]